MSLKAVWFDFNGTIVNDERLHQELIEELLVAENLRPDASEYRAVCLGRSDRACLRSLLERRGRVTSDTYLDGLLARKSEAYRARLAEMPKLPIYPGLEDAIYRMRVANLALGVVTGAQRAEVELVLDRAGLRSPFEVVVAAEDVAAGKPEPDGYLLAVERLKALRPELALRPENCLAIEDTYAGIEAARRAGMQVVGVANTHPFHTIQRRADWAVDYLHELELDRVQQAYDRLARRAG